MKIIRFKSLDFIPAGHEDPRNPGVLKKILLSKPDLLNGRIQMVNWAYLLPNKSFRNHYHEEMEEVFIILNGTVTITIDKEKNTLSKGDAVVVSPRAVHRMTNNSNKEVHYIVIGITSGKEGQTIVVE